MKITLNSTDFFTALGVLAIVFWSTNIAFSRTVMESLGTFTAGACLYLLGGAIGCAYLVANGQLGNSLKLPKKYLLLCGTFFITNMVSFYLAVGLACGRKQVLEVGLINYLWPGLTLLFAVPILHKKARLSLLPGIAMALAGIFLATMEQSTLSLSAFVQNCRDHSVPYLMALIAAISWGLYSCFTRSLGEEVDGDATPLFLLIAGLILLAVGQFFTETAVWSRRAIVELVYVSAFPTFLAYTCWDIAMRKGNVVFLAALSYFIPLISTIISSVHLGIPMTLSLWFACAMVVAGAIICKFSVIERRL